MSSCMFAPENCVVVAEGELCHDGAFHVRALGFPPAEARSELPMASQLCLERLLNCVSLLLRENVQSVCCRTLLCSIPWNADLGQDHENLANQRISNIYCSTCHRINAVFVQVQK
eukprot:36873-Pelagomonas_calceolata.AAC.1